jgi:glutathione peroxidase-family protein
MNKNIHMAKTLSSQTLKKNDNAPPFRLMGTDNKFHSVEDFSGKCLLIVFICNHCPYVKARIGDLVSLQSKFPQSELQIVGINSNDPSYRMKDLRTWLSFIDRTN